MLSLTYIKDPKYSKPATLLVFPFQVVLLPFTKLNKLIFHLTLVIQPGHNRLLLAG